MVNMLGTLRDSIWTSESKHVLIDEDDQLQESFENEKNGMTEPRYTARSTPRTATRTYLVVVVSLLAIFMLSGSLILSRGHYGTRASAIEASNKVLDCGNSVEEAKEKGCIFDVLNYSWVPAVCYDEETVIEFRQWLNQSDIEFGAFPFFEDLKGHRRVAGEAELAKRIGGKEGVLTYSTQQEHRAHCVFTIRRYARTQKNPDKRRMSITFGHLEHCLKEVVEGLKGPQAWEKGRLGSEFGVGFSTC